MGSFSKAEECQTANAGSAYRLPVLEVMLLVVHASLVEKGSFQVFKSALIYFRRGTCEFIM